MVIDKEDSARLFFEANAFAVAGASHQRHKFGNQIFRALTEQFATVYPLNPVAQTVEGVPAFKTLSNLPLVPESVCIVTPPAVTLAIVQEAMTLGVRSIWIQPGAMHCVVKDLAKSVGINLIADGRCVLIELRHLNFLNG